MRACTRLRWFPVKLVDPCRAHRCNFYLVRRFIYEARRRVAFETGQLERERDSGSVISIHRWLDGDFQGFGSGLGPVKHRKIPGVTGKARCNERECDVSPCVVSTLFMALLVTEPEAFGR